MRIILLLSVLLISSCAKQVTTIKQNRDKVLDDGVGYLLLGLQTSADLKRLRISGPEDIILSHKDLKRNSKYILIDLEAGKYSIDKINLNNWWRIELAEGKWEFSVKPGSISYVGHLEVVGRGSWFRKVSSIELENRSSEALEFMEKNYSNILANRKMVYRGPGSDNFFEYVRSLEGGE